MKKINILFFKDKDRRQEIFVWLALFLFFFLAFWSDWEKSFVHALLLTTCLLFAYFIENRYVIKLLQKGRLYWFYFITFLFVIVMSCLTTYIESLILPMMSEYFTISRSPFYTVNDSVIPLLIRVVLFTSVVSISSITALKRIDEENNKIRNELKTQSLDMELKFLKSQMTPHFLFNALNNIYSLVYIHDDKAPESVLKLSDMLRYVLTENQSNIIMLDKEVKYIDAYIDFQKMGMENKDNIIFEKNIKQHNFMIPPMILQPIVENSFKHSKVMSDPNGFVHFYLQQENNTLLFVARNSIKGVSYAVVDPNKKNQSGIGLVNVKKRLELYYGDKYFFETRQEDDCYVTTIKIGDNLNEENV